MSALHSGSNKYLFKFNKNNCYILCTLSFGPTVLFCAIEQGPQSFPLKLTRTDYVHSRTTTSVSIPTLWCDPTTEVGYTDPSVRPHAQYTY